MTSSAEELSIAAKKLQIANHIITMTYPMVKDPRLLLSALEHIFLSFSHALDAVLQHQLKFKKIPAFKDNFSSKLDVFRLDIVPKTKFKEEDAQLLQDLKQTMVEHKKSPVEFARNGQFVICDESYHVTKLTDKAVKKYSTRAKLFIQIASTIVQEK